MVAANVNRIFYAKTFLPSLIYSFPGNQVTVSES